MPTPFDFVILSLSVYRLTIMLAMEVGPFALLERFRAFLGVSYGVDNKPYGTSMLSEMILCPWCLSVWIAYFVALAYWLFPAPTLTVAVVLSFSAISCILASWKATPHG